jgi:hypothetical protein
MKLDNTTNVYYNYCIDHYNVIRNVTQKRIKNSYFPDFLGPEVSPTQIYEVWRYGSMIVHQEFCVLSTRQLWQLFQDQSERDNDSAVRVK